MSDITVNSSELGSNLMGLLEAADIQPGSPAGYELCKSLWEYHPLGGKLVEKPVRLALSKPRIITVDAQPKEILVNAFNKEAQNLGVTSHIRDIMFLKRTYGAAAIVYGAEGIPTNEPIDPWQLPYVDGLYFNKLDPLNLAGSIVTNQNPNAPDFQKPLAYATAAGQPYHPSRSVVVFNGTPIYLSFQSSAFGFTGRSIFLRAIYPLRSFIQSMVTDDLVTFKAGLIVAKTKQSGSIVNKAMQIATGIKREYLQQGTTGNVLSIDMDESIEAINLTNTDTAMTTARNNIIANIAAASDVPALLLKDEAFTQGFGEGSEDAKAIVQYIDGIREEMYTLFKFFDKIVMHRAWNKELFETIQNHPEYGEYYKKMTYEQAFYHWQDNFKAEWETLMEEPESEKVKVEDIKLKGITELLRTVLPVVDPQNRALMIQWAQDNINEMPDLFQSTLTLDADLIAEYEPPQGSMPEEKMPTARGDAQGNTYIDNFYHRGDWANPTPKSDADFQESEHPRDSDGKFTSKGGGSSAQSEPTNTTQKTATIKSPKELARSLKPAKELKNGAYIDHNGFEHSPNLNKQQRRIENNFYYQILKNQHKLIDSYHKEFGNLVDPDAVKKLDPKFRNDASLAGAVHEPSSYLSKVIWKNALAQKKANNDTSPVLFTAGGSGSGKSEAMGLAKSIINAQADPLTFDSVLGNFDKSVSKINEALESQDGKIDIVYTNAPLELAVLLNMKRGRTVKLDTQLEAHYAASENIKKLAEHYKNNDRVKITVVNNTGDPPDLAEGTINDVFTYGDKQEIRSKMVAYAEYLVKNNLIKDKQGNPIKNAPEKLKMLLK